MDAFHIATGVGGVGDHQLLRELAFVIEGWVLVELTLLKELAPISQVLLGLVLS